MGVCASSESETIQDTLVVEEIKPIDPKDLHSRCRKILALGAILPKLIAPRLMADWKHNAEESVKLACIYRAWPVVNICKLLQIWKSSAIPTPAERKSLSKKDRIRREVAILAELKRNVR